MEIRSTLLNSEATRNALMMDTSKSPEITQALGTIDQIGKLYDAVRHVHETVNPKETVEARAMRYEKQFVASITHARSIATQAAEKLQTLEGAIRVQALSEAGLAVAPASAQEIRAALRSLSQKERDKTIADAFERGDAEDHLQSSWLKQLYRLPENQPKSSRQFARANHPTGTMTASMLSLSDLPKCCEQVSCSVTWRSTLKNVLNIWGNSIPSPRGWKKDCLAECQQRGRLQNIRFCQNWSESCQSGFGKWSCLRE